jgi:dienelactone hydrolase
MSITARTTMAALACSLATLASAADVKTRVVDYKQGDTVLQGFIAWDDSAQGRRPGVLVVHEWWGHNEHARNQARRLAEAGYVGFALDLFGKGKVTTHPDQAMAFVAEATKDPAVAASRFDAALQQLKNDPHVDPKQIAAIGYCFGGSIVLAQARSGADLDAVVTFHGALQAATPAKPGAIKSRILVLAGADDPMVPPAQVEAFKQEMTAAGADYRVIMFPGAKHGFTNPNAGTFGVQGLAYNEAADKNSWAEMLKFFQEVFH